MNEQSINQLIDQAQILQCNFQIAQFEYQRALDAYRQAIEYLINLRKQLKDEERRERVKGIIDYLFNQAEQCKKILNQQPVQQDPIQQAFAQPNMQQYNNILNPNNQQPRQQNTQALGTYMQTIETEILDNQTTVEWDQIAGLTTAKTLLQESIILPRQYPHLFQGLRTPPRRILLFGPPGTGKTMLAKAAASQCHSTFFNVSSSTLTSKYFGEAEKLVRALFQVAQQRQPSIIFIDEIDSMLSSRSEGQHDAVRRLQTEFLVCLDGVASNSQDDVVVIGATNRPQELDDAIRRRFVKRILIDLPDAQARQQLIQSLLQSTPNRITGRNLTDIVKKTDGYSGADLHALCHEAAMIPIRKASQQQLASNQIPPIDSNHFKQALKNVLPTVNRATINFYQDWNRQYGSTV